MPRSGIQTCLHLPIFYVTSIEDTELQNSVQKNKDLDTNSRGIYTTDSEADGRRKLGVNRVRTLHIVTRPRAGLTGKLTQDALYEQDSSIKVPVYVMGPYGHPHCFDKYGTILFIVEDIGLFRVLPFIQNLVQGSRGRKNTVRKLEVLWQVKITDFGVFSPSICWLMVRNPAPTNISCVADHPRWVKDQLQKILDLDRRDNFQSRDAPDRHGFDVRRHNGIVLTCCDNRTNMNTDIAKYIFWVLDQVTRFSSLTEHVFRITFVPLVQRARSYATQKTNAGGWLWLVRNLLNPFHYPIVTLSLRKYCLLISIVSCNILLIYTYSR
jgi:hypothetical protein